MKKNIKQNESKDKEKDKNLEFNMLKKLSVVFVALGFFLAFYLLTIYIVNKDSTTNNKTSDKETEANISYDKILLGRSFLMDEESYYVIYYDSSDEDISTIYDDVVANYRLKEEGLPIYYVDMGDSLNKSHITTEQTNKNPTSVDNLYINGPTLIQFKGGNVVIYVEDEAEIKNILS